MPRYVGTAGAETAQQQGTPVRAQPRNDQDHRYSGCVRYHPAPYARASPTWSIHLMNKDHIAEAAKQDSGSITELQGKVVGDVDLTAKYTKTKVEIAAQNASWRQNDAVN